MTWHVIVSGCSGGGKSTLIEALRARGEYIVEEPGRRIVQEGLAGDGAMLPWVDPAAFARRAVEMSLLDRSLIGDGTQRVFFDRGLIDAAVALEYAAGDPAERTIASHPRFYRKVFLAPPWPEIYRRDAARLHGFEAAVTEYERLHAAFPRLGYEIVVLPKTDVATRVEFLLAMTGRDDDLSKQGDRG